MSRILKGSIYLSGVNLLITFINTISFAITTRILSQTEVGITVTFELISSVALSISGLGFTTALIKYISEFRGGKKDYKPLIWAGITPRVLIAIFMALLCFLVAPQISLVLLKSKNYFYLFRLVSFNIIFICLNETLRSIFWGLNELKKIMTIELINTIISQAVIIALLFSGWGLLGYLLGLIIRAILTTAVYLFFLFKDKQLKKYSFRTIGESIKLLFNFSLPVFATEVTNLIYNSFDKIIILAYLHLTDLAIYNVAFKIFRILHIIPMNIKTVLFPFYGEHYGAKNYKTISSTMEKVTRYQALLYTPLAIGIATVSRYAIILFVGKQYASGDLILAVLSIFSLCTIFNPNFTGLLYAFEKEQSVFLLNLLPITISLAITPIFLGSLKLGVMGLALIRGTSYLIRVISFSLYLRKIISIKVGKEAILKSAISGFIMGLTVIIIETLLPGIYMFPVYIGVGGITYLLMLKLTRAINNEDKEVASEILGEKMKPVLKVLRKFL